MTRWPGDARILVVDDEPADLALLQRGLRGAEIALPARIVAVVDVFDALTHARPYKEA